MSATVFCRTYLLLMLSALVCMIYANGSGQIVGIVTDARSGEPLLGANIVLENTVLGASTDQDGFYVVPAVPEGKYVVRVLYLGYRETAATVVVTAGQKQTQNFELEMDNIEGDEVTVTALLEGQAKAINRQLNANTIVNVVSSDRIQELPDQNAAESLGRLPGIAILRDAGEGQKVVVRGLAPKFNSILINGERIPSTDPQDRSVDLSMISPDVLAGIEVFKVITPDMDADAIGGSVNFVFRKAPENFRANARFQYGYNDQQEELGQYRGSFSLSNRYFNNKLGILATGSLQRADRSSDALDADYGFVPQADGPGKIQVENLNLVDILEDRDRFSGGLNLDYALKNGSLRYNGFWARTERDELRRRRRYRINAAYQEIDLRQRQVNTGLFTNSLSGDHHFNFMKINWRTSYSRVKQESPDTYRYRFRELAAFKSSLVDDKGPELIPAGAKNNLDRTFFKNSRIQSEEITDRDITAQLDLKIPLRFGKKVSGFLKMGGKIRDKDRALDKTEFNTGAFGINTLGEEIAQNPGDFYRQFDLDSEDRILISNFIDPDFRAENFLNNTNIYEFGVGLNPDLLNEFREKFPDIYELEPTVDLEDYAAGETITAAYLMAQFNIGSRLTFMPGFRFEHTKNNYQSIFGSPFQDGDTDPVTGAKKDTTGGQSYGEFLPMVQARYKFTSWLDLRTAATRTLSRPNYFNLVPWQRISTLDGTIERGEPGLKHTKVWNYDAYLSVYNRFGLFTLGAFYKNLEDIDFIRTSRLVDPGNPFNGFTITQPENAPENTTIKGLEFDAQTNLRFLPGPLDGIVINVNYSRISSETFYPFFQVIQNLTEPPFLPTIIDTVRVGRMPGQADYIFNLTLGYEKGGFTGRISMINQGKTLDPESIGARAEIDGFTDSFTRWDISLQQKITSSVKIFLNLNNITNQSDDSFLGVERFPTTNQFFGWTADVGVRYKF